MTETYVEKGRAQFLKAALGPTTERKGGTQYYSLRKLMAMNGHSFM